MEEFVPYFVFQGHSVFIPMKYVYPECLVLIHEHDQLFPLKCFQTNCPVNKDCATKLAKRLHFLFQHVVPDAVNVYAYFKHPDKPNSIRAGLFDKDFNEPRLMTLNRSAFRKFMKEGISYKWYPPLEYWMVGGSDKLISVEQLLVKP